MDDWQQKEKKETYPKLITKKELAQLETTFCNKVKDLLQSTCLFDFHGWITVSYLLTRFDPEFSKAYHINAFDDDINVLKYVGGFIHGLPQSDINEAQREYQKVLTKEKIIKCNQITNRYGCIFWIAGGGTEYMRDVLFKGKWEGKCYSR